MNALTIAVILIFIICMAIGYMKGLFRTLLGTVATIIALVLAYLLTPIVSQIIINYTVIDDYIENKTYTAIREQVKKQAEKKLQESGVPEAEAKLNESQLEQIMNSALNKSQQVEAIRSLSLPGYIKTSLLDNNHDEIYEKLQVDNIYRYISKYIAYMIVNLLASILTFLLLRLLLIIFTITVNAAVRNIPLVAGVDHMGGMLLGMITSVILSWLFLLICSAIFGSGCDDMINESSFLTALNNKNLIINIVTDITDILF